MSTVPEGTKKPQDRKAKKDEAKPDEATDTNFEHGGHTYIVPAGAFDDLEILEFLEEDKQLLAVRQMLGRDQWELWKSRNRNSDGRITGAVGEEFMTSLLAEVGQGNSSASSTS